MQVRFVYAGPRGERGEETLQLDAVPRVGEYVHLDAVQGPVRDVSWVLQTLGGGAYRVDVIL